MKTYKVKFIDGTEYRVRFHNTGGVTVVDENGEHEIGTWEKPSDESCMYRCFLFDGYYWEKDWKQKDLADRLASWWKKNRKYV